MYSRRTRVGRICNSILPPAVPARLHLLNARRGNVTVELGRPSDNDIPILRLEGIELSQSSLTTALITKPRGHRPVAQLLFMVAGQSQLMTLRIEKEAIRSRAFFPQALGSLGREFDDDVHITNSTVFPLFVRLVAEAAHGSLPRTARSDYPLIRCLTD